MSRRWADGGLPVELHVLRSDRMSVVPGPDGVARGLRVFGGRKDPPLRGGRGRFPGLSYQRASIRRTITTDSLRCRRQRRRWMCTIRPRAGRRRFWTMPRGRPVRIVYQGAAWTGHADDGPVRPVARGDGGAPPGRAERRTADAASKAGSTGSRWGSRPPTWSSRRPRRRRRGRSRSRSGFRRCFSRDSPHADLNANYQEAKTGPSTG